MNRRRRRAAAVNLFSFQDIMASVIGMVFFVVLIMALDIVTTKAAGQAVENFSFTEDEIADLRSTVAKLSAQIEVTESEVEKLAQKLDLTANDEEALLGEVKQLEATLKSLYARMRSNQDELADTEAERKRAASESRNLLGKLARLNRRLGDLKAQLHAVRTTPRLSFIIDSGPQGLVPWLLEVESSSLRVASADGSGAVLEFGGQSASRAKRAFLAWASSQSNRTHYFVLLIKPSGVMLAEELQEELKKRNFDLGTDLLPEDWEPF